MSDGQSTNGSSERGWLGRLFHAFSVEPTSLHELQLILQDAEKRKVLDHDILSIMEGAFQVAEMRVDEVMIPRPQMVVVNARDEPQDFLPEVIKSTHSRFPVIGENADDIIGILLAKDLLALLTDQKSNTRFQLKNHIRPVTFIPESKRLSSLLDEFRTKRNHMAIVVNEYGGVSGLVTIEDVLEQIVGEIEDETDITEEDYVIKKRDNNTYSVKALMPVDDFNDYFSTQFNDDDFDTIGGIITQHFGRLPKRDEELILENLRFRVVNANNRTIRLLAVERA